MTLPWTRAAAIAVLAAIVAHARAVSADETVLFVERPDEACRADLERGLTELGHEVVDAEPIEVVASFAELGRALAEIAERHPKATLAVLARRSDGELILTSFDLTSREPLVSARAPLASCDDHARLRRLASAFGERLRAGRRAPTRTPECGAGACGPSLALVDEGGVRPSTPVRLIVELKLALSRRTLRFDSSTGPFSNHEIELVPTPGLGFVAYPFAGAFEPLAPLAVSLSYQRSFGLSSLSPENETRFPSRFDDLSLGIHYELALGARLSVTPGVALRRTSFVLGVDEAGRRETAVPSVDYLGVEPRADVRLGLTRRMSLSLGGGYLWVWSDGQDLGSAGTTGLDLRAGIELVVVAPISVAISAAYLTYFFDSEPVGGGSDAIVSIETAIRASF